MVLRQVHGRRTAEDIADLHAWLRSLEGCRPVTDVFTAECVNPVHGAEPGTWFYVEADAANGIARRRCLGCGTVAGVLDSADHWNHAPMWACTSCGQSIAEVAFGASTDETGVRWLAMGLRCVNCGSVAGATDLVVPGLPLEDVTARA